MRFIRRWLNRTPDAEEAIAWPPVDLERVLAAVAEAEAAEPIGLGKRIYTFECQELELRLDRDVTGAYRVTAFEGAERRYSFTAFCARGDYACLRGALAAVVAYLEGERHLADLPKSEHVHGHFFGQPEAGGWD